MRWRVVGAPARSAVRVLVTDWRLVRSSRASWAGSIRFPVTCARRQASSIWSVSASAGSGRPGAGLVGAGAPARNRSAKAASWSAWIRPWLAGVARRLARRGSRARTSRSARSHCLAAGVVVALGVQHPQQVAGVGRGDADLSGELGGGDRLAAVDLAGEPGVGDPL